MDRLTFRHPTGRMWLKECEQYEECDGECWYCKAGLMGKALERLAEYEQTGLAPNEIVLKGDQVQI